MQFDGTVVFQACSMFWRSVLPEPEARPVLW